MPASSTAIRLPHIQAASVEKANHVIVIFTSIKLLYPSFDLPYPLSTPLYFTM